MDLNQNSKRQRLNSPPRTDGKLPCELVEDKLKGKFLFAHSNKLPWWADFQLRYHLITRVDHFAIVGKFEELSEATKTVQIRLQSVFKDNFIAYGSLDENLQIFTEEKLKAVASPTTTFIQYCEEPGSFTDISITLDIVGDPKNIADAKKHLGQLSQHNKSLTDPQLLGLSAFEQDQLTTMAFSLGITATLVADSLTLTGPQEKIDIFTTQSFPQFLIGKAKEEFKRQQDEAAQRQPANSLPAGWVTDANFVGYRSVPLAFDSEDFKRIVDRIHLRDPSAGVVQIDRIENPTRFLQYQIQRDSVTTKLHNSGVNPVEMRLFHGTLERSVDGICREGFNRSLGGQNGNTFGNGCYFSNDFSFSLDYCKGGKKIFLCDVIVGRYQVNWEKKQMKVTDFLPGSTVERYDSVINQDPNPYIFETFSDNSAYPSYLITLA